MRDVVRDDDRLRGGDGGQTAPNDGDGGRSTGDGNTNGCRRRRRREEDEDSFANDCREDAERHRMLMLQRARCHREQALKEAADPTTPLPHGPPPPAQTQVPSPRPQPLAELRTQLAFPPMHIFVNNVTRDNTLVHTNTSRRAGKLTVQLPSVCWLYLKLHRQWQRLRW